MLPEDIVIGETYNLHIGQAKVDSFYEEGGFDKVRFLLRPLNPADISNYANERGEVLMSTPIENFRNWQLEFGKDKVWREMLAKRKRA